ncbi:acetyltransferase (GNAT) family protein [Sarocladium implicatum]|nr:acetyltransferase (GNAT) family protein [Sarocladium implicatum]
MAVDGLFSSDLISPDVSAVLPEGYRLRALRKTDFASGFLDCLRVLTTVGEISQEQFEQQFDDMEKLGSYYIIVIEDTNRSSNSVVGTGALIVEKKFLGNVGHIEDIAVAKDQQGKKLGLRLIQALDYVADKVGCYKSILDCSEANEGFYVKCGFRRAGLQMAHYYNDDKKGKSS